MKRFQLFYGIIFIIFMLFVLACNGSKQTVRYTPEPDPFPEPAREPVKEDVSEAKPTPVEPEADISQVAPLELMTVFFDFDASFLTEEAKALLAENALGLQQHPETSIRVEGHCDERGTVEYNLALGERRALSVRNYLVNFGINPGRITIISYGKERPLDYQHSETAWAKNRRAEFVILN